MKNWTEEKNIFKVELENGKVVKISSKWVYDTCDTLELDITEAIEMWLEDNGYLENEEQEQLDTQAKASGVKVKKKKKTERKKVVRERKPNPTKEMIISKVAEMLNSFATDVKVENIGKIITFKVENKDFKIDLTEKRVKKQ